MTKPIKVKASAAADQSCPEVRKASKEANQAEEAVAEGDNPEVVATPMAAMVTEVKVVCNLIGVSMVSIGIMVASKTINKISQAGACALS